MHTLIMLLVFASTRLASPASWGETLATENRAALESLRAWLAPGSPALGQLCGANGTRPWPRRGDAPLRWLHIPKCGSMFASTYLRYVCPSLDEAATLGAEIPAALRWTAAPRLRVTTR